MVTGRVLRERLRGFTPENDRVNLPDVLMSRFGDLNIGDSCEYLGRAELMRRVKCQMRCWVKGACADMFASLATATVLWRSRWKFPLLQEEGGGRGGMVCVMLSEMEDFNMKRSNFFRNLRRSCSPINRHALVADYVIKKKKVLGWIFLWMWAGSILHIQYLISKCFESGR